MGFIVCSSGEEESTSQEMKEHVYDDPVEIIHQQREKDMEYSWSQNACYGEQPGLADLLS